MQWKRVCLLLCIVMSVFGSLEVSASDAGSAFVLENFQQSTDTGFPEGWEAQRSVETAQKTYEVIREDQKAFLRANDASQRVYTRIAWNPREKPIVSWRWRAQSIPDHADLVAAVFISLDTDLLFIPVATKYVWSSTKAKGTITEGGLFGSTEVVVQSGRQPVGEWVEVHVNAYQDFLSIHQHEPADEAWGISLLGGPGIEIDFGSIEVHVP